MSCGSTVTPATISTPERYVEPFAPACPCYSMRRGRFVKFFADAHFAQQLGPVVIFAPDLHMIALDLENADHGHLAVVALVHELVGALDHDDITDAADIVDVQRDALDARAQRIDPLGDGGATVDRLDHHRMQHAILGEQIAHQLPVAAVPGVDHLFDYGNLGVGH